MISVGIVGGTGYTGVELLRILAMHPNAEINIVTSRAEAGNKVSSVYPSLCSGLLANLDLHFTQPDVSALKECDCVFFAAPNGTAMQMVPELLKADVKVVDLAADFRIKDPDIWAHWYKQAHACPDILQTAVYGCQNCIEQRLKMLDWSRIRVVIQQLRYLGFCLCWKRVSHKTHNLLLIQSQG